MLGEYVVDPKSVVVAAGVCLRASSTLALRTASAAPCLMSSGKLCVNAGVRAGLWVGALPIRAAREKARSWWTSCFLSAKRERASSTVARECGGSPRESACDMKASQAGRISSHCSAKYASDRAAASRLSLRSSRLPKNARAPLAE
eukprot:scaffold125197_cov30-Tisochrysis_lutea.AAC.2